MIKRHISTVIKNLHAFAPEMFKSSNNLSLEIVKEIFLEPSNKSFTYCHVNSVHHGTESLSFFGPKFMGTSATRN